MISKKLFIASSALYAFIDRSDPNHLSSVKVIEQLSLQEFKLYLAFPTLLKTHSLIQEKLGELVAQDFLEAISQSSIEIVYPQKKDLKTAVRLMSENKDKKIELEEALTAVLMQTKGAFQVLTFEFWPNLLGSKQFHQGITISNY